MEAPELQPGMTDEQRRQLMRTHTTTVNGGRKPKFGDRMRNLWAGDRNPHRDATFLRVVRRTGRMNPGTWYEMTDEHGDFWLSSPDGLVFLDCLGANQGPEGGGHADADR